MFGVDVNPMAVELCKVSLWMEAIEPGRPLSFLDAHIQCGNALLGATPALLARGIPEDAFEPIEGDDKKVASALKKQNKKERAELTLDFAAAPASIYVRLGEGARAVDGVADDNLDAVRFKQRRWEELVASSGYHNARFLSDLWCAAFVWRKEAGTLRALAPTEATYRAILKDAARAPGALRDEVVRLRDEYQLFHWHLAFPQVLRPKAGTLADADPCGWDGGFDVVLGNPPWEKVKLLEKEFFAERAPEVAAAATTAAREAAISRLKTEFPDLSRAFEAARRVAEGTSHLLRRTDSLSPLREGRRQHLRGVRRTQSQLDGRHRKGRLHRPERHRDRRHDESILRRHHAEVLAGNLVLFLGDPKILPRDRQQEPFRAPHTARRDYRNPGTVRI